MPLRSRHLLSIRLAAVDQKHVFHLCLSLLPVFGFLILVERRCAGSTPRFTRLTKNATITFRRIYAMNNSQVTVVGAGLAGSEAAYQLARRGIRVRLVEMRPVKMTEAHRTADFAELVCSNSLRNDSMDTAVGVLKEEMRRLGSLVIASARRARVPAGSPLRVP